MIFANYNETRIPKKIKDDMILNAIENNSSIKPAGFNKTFYTCFLYLEIKDKKYAQFYFNSDKETKAIEKEI